MLASDFISTWRSVDLTELAAASALEFAVLIGVIGGVHQFCRSPCLDIAS